MWKMFKKITRTLSTKLGVIEIDGVKVADIYQKLEVLNEYFAKLGEDQNDDQFDDEYHEQNK